MFLLPCDLTQLQIAEEQSYYLDAPLPDLQPPAPNDMLIPRTIALFASPSEDVRALAVGVLNLLFASMPAALLVSMDR
jgi:hypothetical protein